MSSSAVSPFRRSNSFLAVRTPTTSSTLGMVSVKEKGSHDDLDDDHYVEDVENYNGGMSYTSQTGNKTGMFSLSSRLPNLLGTTSTATTNNSDNTDQQIETSPNHNGSSNGGGTSSLLGSTFNLSKTIVGAGFLSLPYGIASFADNSLAIIPSLLLLMSIGWIAIYSFKSIGRACEMYHAKSFAEVWSRVVDNKTSRLLPLIIVIKTLLGCLAFSIVISDLLVGICGRFDCPIIFMNRNIVLVVVTTFVLYPLACMKKLDALKYSSAIGLVATIYCAVFIMIRYCDRSYQEGGRYFRDIDKHLQPFFSSATHPTQVTNTGSYILINPMVFVLLSMMSTAYVAHFNAPKFWAELQDATRQRFEVIVNRSFGLAITIYIISMATGYLTFGGHCSGNILNNYSNHDNLATIARIGLTFGLIASYPLTFTALRDNFCELLQIDDDLKETTYFYPLTISLFVCITICATRFSNVGVVTGFSGALIGSLLIYIIPAVINLCIISRKRTDLGIISLLFAEKVGLLEKLEVVGNAGMLVMGVTVAVVGVMVNIQQ